MQQESVGTFSLDDNVWQGVTITDSAAAQITRLMQQDPEIKGLQLGVKQSGCAGFAYVMDMAKEPASDVLVSSMVVARYFTYR
uniref:Protein sufA n=1 Tax=Yersinia enterocolitica W22703 TaxID=913028 RepID=F4N0B2_YEREN|nr:protein sufA [Yersinia enterocolitica W22703]